MDNKLTMDELVDKANKLKATGGLDLSMEEDLSIAVMNLISLEEHFYFTAEKTGDRGYLDMLGQVREIRKQLLARMIDEYEGETWCIAKHLLAATMRLIEVGTKQQSSGDSAGSQDAFKKAYEIYSLFWVLRLKLADASVVKKSVNSQVNLDDRPRTTEEIISKLVDCCKE